MAYSFTNMKGITYYLHTKEVTLRGGRRQNIFYFRRDLRPGGIDIPQGKRIVENARTGMPMLTV